jgi:hypothetical protein
MLFDGDRSGVDAFLRTISGRYYVYILRRPDGAPFYVGKGLNRRALEHEAEARRAHPLGETNPLKCNVIRKIIREGGCIRYCVDSVFDQDEQLACLEREAALIQQYRRLHEGGCLTNLAGGLGNMSGAAPASLERHSATLSGTPVDNPERATLNCYLQSIGPVESVPVKPINQLKPILPTTPHPSPRQPKPRNAYALIASAGAHGVMINAGARIPRRFTFDGIEGIIENGVARDILKAGLASLEPAQDPRDEVFAITGAQARLITQLVGKRELEARGLR